MTVFDKLQPAAFGNFQYPIEGMRLRLSIRHHIHEYPHAPKGKLEKLGRKLYECSMNAVFDATFDRYKSLWPDRLRSIREMVEQEKTDYVVLPTVGTLRMCMVDYEETMSSEHLSGVRATFTFVEDPEDLINIDQYFKVDVTGLSAQDQTLADAAAADPSLLQSVFDVLNKIHDAVNSVLALKDEADLYSNLLESKILFLSGLCGTADSLLTDPANTRVIDALHDLWAAAIDLGKDVIGKGDSIVTYRVPKLMTISEVARAVFADATRATEILQMNAIDDALAIPAGTILKHYDT